MPSPADSPPPPPTPPSADVPLSADPAAIGLTPPAPIIPIITPTLTYTQKVFIAVGTSAAAILCAILIYYVAEIIVLCFAGLLLAVFISAPADLLAKHTRLKRSQALLIVLTTLAIIVLGGGYFMGSTVYDQSRRIYRDSRRALNQVDFSRFFPASTQPATAPATLPADLTPVSATENALPPGTFPATAPATQSVDITLTHEEITDTPADWLTERLSYFRQSATKFLSNETVVQSAGGVAGSFITSTFGIIGNMVIVFGVGLFFAINPSLYTQGLIRLVPISRRARTATILNRVGTQLEWWFVGQLCSMASIGLLTFVGLSILHVPMALTLAILAGLMNFIPNFGPILAAAPAVLIALAPHGNHTQLNPALAGWVILMYVIIQLLEGWVITPYFQARAVELPPALIIISQFIFGLLLGPLGLVLATPILATLVVLVRLLYIEDILGDKAPDLVLPNETQ